MKQQPIAFADPSGYVTSFPSGSLPEHIDLELTPLYTQDEVDASMARFYAAQGLTSDGVPIDAHEPQTDEEVQAVLAAQEDFRISQGKAATGVSVAEELTALVKQHTA